MNFDFMWTIQHGHTDLVYSLISPAYHNLLTIVRQVLGHRTPTYGHRCSNLPPGRLRENVPLPDQEGTRPRGQESASRLASQFHFDGVDLLARHSSKINIVLGIHPPSHLTTVKPRILMNYYIPA